MNLDRNLRFSKISFVLASLLSAAFLTGCGDNVKRTFGMDRTAPDEFQVIERAPLAMPPDYHLNPPKPGEKRPQELSTKERAAQSVMGQNQAPQDNRQSKGLNELLLLAGTEGADPQIRQTVEKDNKSYVKADKNFADKLIFWQEQAPVGDVVDPVQETKRIKDNKAAGKNITEGDTPTIKRKKKAPLEGLFD